MGRFVIVCPEDDIVATSPGDRMGLGSLRDTRRSRDECIGGRGRMHFSWRGDRGRITKGIAVDGRSVIAWRPRSSPRSKTTIAGRRRCTGSFDGIEGPTAIATPAW
jgi:hypothetical protein